MQVPTNRVIGQLTINNPLLITTKTTVDRVNLEVQEDGVTICSNNREKIGTIKLLPIISSRYLFLSHLKCRKYFLCYDIEETLVV